MNISKIRLQALVLLHMFVLQFLVGMFLNLFVTIPTNHPGRDASNYFGGGLHGLLWALSGRGGWELAVHVYIASILVIGSVILLCNALAIKSRNWSAVSALTAVFTIGAFFNGLSFINYNHNVSSMIMATCWMMALGSLVFGISRFRQ